MYVPIVFLHTVFLFYKIVCMADKAKATDPEIEQLFQAGQWRSTTRQSGQSGSSFRGSRPPAQHFAGDNDVVQADARHYRSRETTDAHRSGPDTKHPGIKIMFADQHNLPLLYDCPT